MMTTDDILASAHRTFQMESDAICELRQHIDESFAHACQLLLSIEGRVIVTGMGKSGHIANKLAATLASTGTPAFYVHPAEASHGDMGMITAKDAVIALSNSGTTPEVMTLLPLLQRLGVPLICITGNADSSLATSASVHLFAGVRTEACPLDLAPTSSTTAALVMGDALAIALLECRGFTAEDFAFSHPGGALGRRLLLKVDDVMVKGSDIPRVTPEATLGEALMEITEKGLGMTTISRGGELLGIFTDGDLRRALDNRPDINEVRIGHLMSPGGRTLPEGTLAAKALGTMEQFRISSVVVTDANNHIKGVVQLLSLLKAGLA